MHGTMTIGRSWSLNSNQHSFPPWGKQQVEPLSHKERLLPAHLVLSLRVGFLAPGAQKLSQIQPILQFTPQAAVDWRDFEVSSAETTSCHLASHPLQPREQGQGVLLLPTGCDCKFHQGLMSPFHSTFKPSFSFRITLLKRNFLA